MEVITEFKQKLDMEYLKLHVLLMRLRLFGVGIFYSYLNIILGGYIIPRQEPGLTTLGTHENEFKLLITLSKYRAD